VKKAIAIYNHPPLLILQAKSGLFVYATMILIIKKWSKK